MIANWNAVVSICGKWNWLGLNKWAIALLKREESTLGTTIASIELKEEGTLFLPHAAMNHTAEVLGTVYSERFVFEFPTIRQFTDDEYEAWHRERAVNIAKGISAPSESAFNTIMESHHHHGVEFG